MITAAQWADMNGDGRKDLVLCGEMMPIMIFENTTTGFIDKTSDYFAKPQSGFWFGLQVADVNGDGKPDIIAGNLGLNSQIKASENKPAERCTMPTLTTMAPLTRFSIFISKIPAILL